MDTSDALKKAMAALKAAEIPESLWPTALPLALQDIREQQTTDIGRPKRDQSRVLPTAADADSSAKQTPKATAKPKARRSTGATGTSKQASDTATILSSIPEEGVFFEAIERETGVARKDLADVFHIDSGRLEIKVPSKDLGSTNEAATKTVSALLAGAVFSGTDHRTLPFSEIHSVCKAKHCYDPNRNGAKYVRSTPNFATVGPTRTPALSTRSGWQTEFAAAVRRVLKQEAPKK